MSCPVNFQALAGGVFQEVFNPGNIRGRNSFTQLSFPESRSALWDSSTAGEKLHLQLCAHRKPRVVLLEKALRLAQRHARRSNKPRLLCFFLGSASVSSDEEGVVVTLDRFDPGRDQAGAAGRDQAGAAGRDQAGTLDRVPSALLPGDVLVPCLFSVQSDPTPDPTVQSEAELHQCFKVLQQFLSDRQTLDLSHLLRIRAHLVVSQAADAAALSLSWSAVCPAIGVDVQPVRAVPVVPTALQRSLTCVGRPPQPAGRQRGFLTMDQTRKLVLLLESDPKAASLPLVGLWLSGVTHVYNPQVWAWCLRFMFSSALQDRVLSESGCFLLVVFGSTHRTPQFFQCRRSGPEQEPGPQLDFQLLSGSQSVTLYQVAPVEGRVLKCELGPEGHDRQAEVFRAAQKSFSRTPPPAARPSVSDQDSGVEDEDFSPRPSPSPHLPAPQARRIQPLVPELSLLIDSSFSSNHSPAQASDPAHRPPPPAAAPPSSASSSAPKPPPHLHSTPNSNLQQPCSCCSSHTFSCTPIFSSPTLLSAPPPSSLQSAPLHPVLPACSHQQTPPLSSRHTPPPPPSFSYQQIAPPSGSRHTPPSTNCLSTPPAPLTSSHQQTPPLSSHPTPPSSHQNALPPSTNCPSTLPAPLASLHQQTPPFSSRHCAPPPSSFSHQQTPPRSTNSPATPPVPPASIRPSDLQNSPPLSTLSPSTFLLPPAPACPCSHTAPPPLPHPCWSDSPSPAVADPVSPSWLPCPSCRCSKTGGVAPSDTYRLLLHQDRQLRLLQAQIQMLLEAQGTLQSSSQQVGAQTASVAVETGASLFWGNELHREELRSPNPPPSSSPSPSASSHDQPVGGAEDCSVSGQAAPGPSPDPHRFSGLQSPVLGESVSMFGPPDEQQSFYQNLMTQLNSRLQESNRKQDAEDGSRRSSTSPSVSDRSQSSQSSSCSSSKRKQKKTKSPDGDPVVRATLRQLQQLGVSVDEKDLMDTTQVQAVENASTLATINPAAVVSRLTVSEGTGSALFPGGSVDLSLEANAIALRYLSDSQLSRLSLGGHAPQNIPAPSSSSGDSLMSPSNMSLATRKYMRRYGLIEEDDGEEEEREEVLEARRPLTNAQNLKLLPQSQLIQELRPKMQLLAGDKENRSSRRPPEASVGNLLDLRRLRQLPKLF
ncbi:SCL-interrupting locus protein homolog isoform X2 [Kryptolebias marmoratus]|uniref:SCL-interrupting locus protein homolog isoform X2 n=1 Tax=Kryptolebias marmoratus TaxID=37003 RepID=UPI000D52FAC3|nr:SCL-interrupting locus protein homolog isoform X2 [Kryptolebias marmoratus]